MLHTNIMKKLESAGFEVFMVGGCVRDELLGLPVKDYDLATNASPEEICAVFDNAVELHSRCGAPVVSVGHIEVASFRKEKGKRKNTRFEPATMEEDALRRDFTVNALYKGLDGIVHDPTGEGLDDLVNGLLYFIGDGSQRIVEDPTRILRGFRLAAQKGLHLAPLTAIEMMLNRNELKRIAGEQVGKEFKKLLSVPSSSRVADAFRSMGNLGLLEHVFPELDSLRGLVQNDHHLEGDAFVHTMLVLANCGIKPTVRMAALLHDVGKSRAAEPRENDTGNTFYGHENDSVEMGREMLRRISVFDKNERQEILFCVENHMRILYCFDMNRKKRALILRSKHVESLLELAVADSYGKIPADMRVGEILKYCDKFKSEDKLLGDLGIDAKLLMGLGEVPGKVLGDKLRMMQNLLDKNPKLDKDSLLRSVGLPKS